MKIESLGKKNKGEKEKERQLKNEWKNAWKRTNDRNT